MKKERFSSFFFVSGFLSSKWTEGGTDANAKVLSLKALHSYRFSLNVSFDLRDARQSLLIRGNAVLSFCQENLMPKPLFTRSTSMLLVAALGVFVLFPQVCCCFTCDCASLWLSQEQSCCPPSTSPCDCCQQKESPVSASGTGSRKCHCQPVTDPYTIQTADRWQKLQVSIIKASAFDLDGRLTNRFSSVAVASHLLQIRSAVIHYLLSLADLITSPSFVLFFGSVVICYGDFAMIKAMLLSVFPFSGLGVSSNGCEEGCPCVEGCGCCQTNVCTCWADCTCLCCE